MTLKFERHMPKSWATRLTKVTRLRNELSLSTATGGLRGLVSNIINFGYVYGALKCLKAKRKEDGGRSGGATERAAKC